MYDPEKKSLTKFGAYPEHSGVSEHSYCQALDSHVAVDSANNRVAVFYWYTDLFEIYDVDSGERLARVHGPDGFYPRFREEFVNNAAIAYPIYGETRTAYFNCIDRGGMLWASYGGFYFASESPKHPIVYLYAFDWNGKPLMKFKLDHKISGFDVDPARRTIYTSVEDKSTGNFHLYRYVY